MQPDALDENQLSSYAQALLNAVSALVADRDQRVYAVMDGSQFDDLPRLLKEAGIAHRPLYRYAGEDYAVILGGPWLVDAYQTAVPSEANELLLDDDDGEVSDEELVRRSASLSETMVSSLNAGDPTGGGVLPAQDGDIEPVIGRLRKLVELSDGKPALVFWCGDQAFSAEQLYRHLRGLNRISVPKSWRNDPESSERPKVANEVEFAAAGDDVPLPDTSPDDREIVIFRHADANVMMQTIPALNELQVARLFGPASNIIFAPGVAWGGGVKRARKASDLVPGRGVLELDRDAMAAMSASRLEVSRKRIMAYLRDTDTENNTLSDAELRKKVLFYEASGAELGLRSERAHGQWAFLMSSSNGAIAEEREIRSALKSSRDADQTLAQLMNEMVKIGDAELSGKRVLGGA